MTARRDIDDALTPQHIATRDYLEALDAVGQLITDPTRETVERVLAHIARAARADAAALFRHPAD
ncbi:hypothetical protein, partial [Chitinimonas sp.]|uniref:hypothetical protein n=1 Tax=Chitinimonas sp. TaxID=1934313 RepID=UPI0035B1DED1